MLDRGKHLSLRIIQLERWITPLNADMSDDDVLLAITTALMKRNVLQSRLYALQNHAGY